MRAFLTLAVLATLSPFAVGQPAHRGAVADESQVVEFTGETLDRSGYGPGYIEAMDVVVARQAAREAAGDIPDEGAPRNGQWAIPTPGASEHPASGIHYVTNRYGASSMGIAFPTPVTLVGASPVKVTTAS